MARGVLAWHLEWCAQALWRRIWMLSGLNKSFAAAPVLTFPQVGVSWHGAKMKTSDIKRCIRRGGLQVCFLCLPVAAASSFMPHLNACIRHLCAPGVWLLWWWFAVLWRWWMSLLAVICQLYHCCDGACSVTWLGIVHGFVALLLPGIVGTSVSVFSTLQVQLRWRSALKLKVSSVFELGLCCSASFNFVVNFFISVFCFYCYMLHYHYFSFVPKDILCHWHLEYINS